MLADSAVYATIAVKDIESGKNFYGGTLGLRQKTDFPDGVLYESGGGHLLVYQSQTAGSGQATCASWQVADVEAVVAELKGKGVTFEHYDLPGSTLEGDVHVIDDMKAAWFKDPDGNVLAINNDQA